MGGRTPKVLVLGWEDESDEGSLSGMPWNMRQSVAKAGCEVLFGSIGTLRRGPAVFRSQGGHSPWMRRLKRRGRAALEQVLPSLTLRGIQRLAKTAAQVADEVVRTHEPDVVLAPCMSWPVGFMKTTKPIVYASDATAALICRTYPSFEERGRAWKDAIFEFESATLARADRTVVASGATRRSAIEEHGADPDRVLVVPMGANIQRPDDQQIDIPASPADPSDLRLLLVAADPERKRLQLSLSVIRELRSRGWNATLHYVGPERASVREAEVVWEGELRLGDSADRETHRRLLRECHLSFMPSTAEMFGIAPIESASFGRPGVVSDVGGLPTVVLDGQTGRVVPVDAPVPAWADAVLDLVGTRDRYAAASISAHRRSHEVLNWDRWGQTVRALMETLV